MTVQNITKQNKNVTWTKLLKFNIYTYNNDDISSKFSDVRPKNILQIVIKTKSQLQTSIPFYRLHKTLKKKKKNDTKYSSDQ